MNTFDEKVKERLIRYAKVNTQSANHTGTVPSTKCQFDLAKMLYQELQDIGVKDTYYDDEHCVVYAWLKANTEDGMPVGFVAHMDTAPDASGENVRPWVFSDYDGSDIVLNKEKNIVMKVSDYPNLKNYIHQDLILTDGTTLLGGDDKASIAAIMTMIEYLVNHPERKHNLLAFAFTPDEEVGGLAKDLDLDRFQAKVAYTLDGDYCGYYEDETFNASEAIVTFTGLSVHTGTAKGIMKNAVDMGAEFMGMLPKLEKPQYTEGREGFYHVISFDGTCEHARLTMIVRDHDSEIFNQRNNYLKKITEEINRRYGSDAASIEISIQYRNLGEAIKKVPFMIPNLVKAIEMAGITPHKVAFRGGTDGSALSWRGLPCPNLSAGYENAHGRFEYVPVQSMSKNVEILLNLADLYSQQK
ncbi:MAG: peptidase T [Lactimicrobium sp.]|jgi:tripeptide aminopeptidase|uniref:peptidase T n=1 Tax=Lactimicrobium sp. TaxID=2563780 RepID=UPI002F35BDCC